MTRRRAALVGTLVAALTLTALPATAQDADDSGGTSTTFEVSSDSNELAISAPTGTETLSGFGTGGGEASFTNSVTVTDSRTSGLLGERSWEVYVDGGPFTHEDSSVERAIQPSEVEYLADSAPIALDSGLSLETNQPQQVELGSTTAALSTGTISLLELSGDGVTETTWTPTLILTPASPLIDGNYTGTVTHSLHGS